MGRIQRVAVALALIATTIGVVGTAHAAPPNDDLADATVIGSLPFTDAVDNTDATDETLEARSPCGPLSTASVWYRYTSPSTQRLDITTVGSEFNTVVTVYEGEPVYPGVTCSDPSGLDGAATTMALNAIAGHTYNIQVQSYADALSEAERGMLFFAMTAYVEPDPSVVGCGACDFAIYPVPSRYNYRAGETSIGVDPETNRAILLMLTRAMRAEWDDTQSPPAVTWKEVTGPVTGSGTNDPILWTDRTTGRTFAVQLRALGAGAVSLIEYTDDDGETWQAVEPGQVNPSWDHESVGGGPRALPLPDAVYPNVLYYCAQLGFPFSQCQRSHDGGVTWDAGLPMNTGSCAGLHGHIKVGPDGTVYVPHKSCNGGAAGRQGLMVSTNEGLLWQPRIVPIPTTSRSDPAVSIDTSGRLYFATVSGGHPVVTTSTTKGASWTTPIDVGTAFGIQNVEQPMAIAGDDGRAAIAFYGTPTAGDDQSSTFDGEWHIYASFTYDGGQTWTTQDLTPNDPAQRGCIWMAGGSSPCRNLLDFQGMTIDGEGRVLVGYADGCTSAACVAPTGTPNDSRASRGVIARQISGRRLIAAFDP
jgi:hypothetical protein